MSSGHVLIMWKLPCIINDDHIFLSFGKDLPGKSSCHLYMTFQPLQNQAIGHIKVKKVSGHIFYMATSSHANESVVIDPKLEKWRDCVGPPRVFHIWIEGWLILALWWQTGLLHMGMWSISILMHNESLLKCMHTYILIMYGDSVSVNPFFLWVCSLQIPALDPCEHGYFSVQMWS